jgi:hypothetical protein
MGRSAALTYGSYVGVSVLGLVNVLLVARVLGPVGRGDIAFLMAVAGLTAFMFNLSVQEANGNLAGLRPHKTSSLLTNSLLLSVVLGLAAAATAVATLEYVPLLRREVPKVDLILALVSMPLLILQTYLVYLARGGYYFAIANWALLLAPITTLVANAGATAAGELTVTFAIGA